jgi:glycosyltransferase involved in cell wall biosynthesis
MESVSVCIATYNGAQFIIEQLSSVLDQLDETDEIIISDDHSTDHTLSLISSLKDSRIRILMNPGEKGHLHNFEHALNHALHNYIFLADQDDVWVAGRLDAMKAALANNDIVITDHSVIDKDGTIVMNSYFEKFPFRSKPGLFRNLWRHSFSGCCMGFRRHMLKIALPFPPGIGYHDYWLGLIGNLFFKVEFINYPYTLYRDHSNNVSYGTSLKSGNTLLTKLMIRFSVIKYIPLLIKRRINHKRNV